MRMSVYKDRTVYFIYNESLIPKGKSGASKFTYNICLRSKLGLTWV